MIRNQNRYIRFEGKYRMCGKQIKHLDSEGESEREKGVDQRRICYLEIFLNRTRLFYEQQKNKSF